MEKQVAISLPFRIDTYGKVGSTTEQTKIWSDRVLSVVGTSLRERSMRPQFGTVIPFAMFEGVEPAAVQVQSEIQSAFLTQLPLLNFRYADVTVDEITNIMTADIVYELPNGELASQNIGLVFLNGIDPYFQELL